MLRPVGGPDQQRPAGDRLVGERPQPGQIDQNQGGSNASVSDESEADQLPAPPQRGPFSAEVFAEAARNLRSVPVNIRTEDQPRNAFEKHFQAAERALEYVNSISQVSVSRMSDAYSSFEVDDNGAVIEATSRPNHGDLLEVLDAIRSDSTRWRDEQQAKFAEQGIFLSNFEREVLWLRTTADIIDQLKDRIGPDQLCLNCLEKSMSAFEHLAFEDNNPRLEVVQLVPTSPIVSRGSITGTPSNLSDGPDHAVLVIGRDTGSDLRFPETWHEDTVICDALVNRAYAVGSVQEEMDFLSSLTNGATRFELKIALPENTVYNPNVEVPYLTADGAGEPHLQLDETDIAYRRGG